MCLDERKGLRRRNHRLGVGAIDEMFGDTLPGEVGERLKHHSEGSESSEGEKGVSNHPFGRDSFWGLVASFWWGKKMSCPNRYLYLLLFMMAMREPEG